MRGPSSRLTLVIPSFFHSIRGLEPMPRLPALETLLARGNRREGACGSYEQCLFTRFGHDTDLELPVGAVRRVGDGATADEGWWYCAEPVHFLADRDRVHVIANQDLAVRADEADAFARLFNTHFAVDGWRLEVAHPERWYLRAPVPQTVRTVPLAQAAAQDLRSVLPTGAGALRWHGFINEIQMLFHGCDVNRSREQRGLPAINGMWLWGGGKLPPLAHCFDCVLSDDPLARGLATLSGSEVSTLSSGFGPAVAGNTLAVLKPNMTSSWWLETELSWFAPVKNALSIGSLEHLVIDAVPGIECHVARRDLRRWWRRTRPLSVYL